MRAAPLLVPLAFVLMSCSYAVTDDASGGGGKADAPFDAGSCPASVKVNGASGSARRCVDTVTGRFVPTLCCHEECEGAFWREQESGAVCAWGDDPGTEGAQSGQFAPSLCCRLNDTLACSRAQLQDGACVDPETGAAVTDECCGGAQCNPILAGALRECVDRQIHESRIDPETFTVTEPEALDLCAAEGDLFGPIFDELCLFFDDLEFCDESIETFAQDHVEPCRAELAPELDCAFGRTYADLVGSVRDNIVITDRTTLKASDIPGFDAGEADRILEAIRQSAFDPIDDLAEGFSFVDGGEIARTELWEGSNSVAYVAYEFGAGDNSFGAIFEHDSGTLAARIIDSDLYDASDDPLRGCRIPRGRRWARCQSSSDCQNGDSCSGIIDHPVHGPVGKCINPDLGSAATENGDTCHEPADCPVGDGLGCAGIETFDAGFCRPLWMFASFEDASSSVLPSGGSSVRELAVFGLASVPEGARLRLDIVHADPAELRVELENPLGTATVIFDGGPTAGVDIGATGITVDQALAVPGDEDANGVWRLRIEDQGSGVLGIVHAATLTLSSRFD